MIYNCHNCGSPQNFEIAGSYTRPGFTLSTAIFYTLAACQKCKHPALFERSVGEPEETSLRIWPPHARHIDFSLPESVKDSYDEAVHCEIARLPKPTVVMVRRAIEAICKDYDSNCRTIYDGLQGMLKNGVISQEIMDWATELRVLGNKGAHATSEKITEVEATESLDFLQAILQIFYYLRPKFRDMQERKKA